MRTLQIRILFIIMSVAMFSVCTFAGIVQPTRKEDVIVSTPSYGDEEDSDDSADDNENAAGSEGAGDPPATEPDLGTDTDPAEPDTETPQEPESAAAQYIRSKVNGLTVRSGPGSSYSALGYLDKDDMVTLYGQSGSWYRTVYRNKTAYVSASSSYTEIYTIPIAEQNETVEKIIEEGLKLLGFPYVYGATRLHDGRGNLISSFDATKYDCSSLMQYIYYYGANINLNMTTRTQVTQGKYVAKEDIQRGDLIFFTNSTRYNNTGIERIGHVALYLGDNYILHTASDYAVIEQISATRWSYYIETRTFF